MEEDGTRPRVLGHLRLGAPGRGRSDLPRTPHHSSGVQAAGLAPGRSQSSVGARCRPEHPSEGWTPGPAHPSTSAPALGVGFAQRDPGGCGDRPRGAAVGAGSGAGAGWAGHPRPTSAPAQCPPAHGDSNLPLRFLPAPRPGSSARPSLLWNQAPTDGRTDARTKGPVGGQARGRERSR